MGDWSQDTYNGGGSQAALKRQNERRVVGELIKLSDARRVLEALDFIDKDGGVPPARVPQAREALQKLGYGELGPPDDPGQLWEATAELLMRRTGLARGTVWSTLNLLDSLLEQRTVPQRRRAILHSIDLSLRPGAVLAGMEIDHDHVLVMLADLAGRVQWEGRWPEGTGSTGIDESPQDALEHAARLVATGVEHLGLEPRDLLGMALSLPVPVNRSTGKPCQTMLPAWAGISPADELRASLDLPEDAPPIVIDNDANLGALGEFVFGAALRYRLDHRIEMPDGTIYIKAGHGLGAGLVYGEHVYRGAGWAGEIGHLVLRYPHPLEVPAEEDTTDDGANRCIHCGRTDCLESLTRLGFLMPKRQFAKLENGGWANVAEVLNAASNDDAELVEACQTAADTAGALLGQALASAVTLLAPKLIVVGGSRAAAWRSKLQDDDGPIARELREFAVVHDRKTIDIREGTLGERAVALGGIASLLHHRVDSLLHVPREASIS